MKRSESKYSIDKFFQRSIDLLCIADKEGKFVRLNPEWEKTLGYKTTELEGKSYIEFVHPDDIYDTAKATENLANNEEVIDFINRYRHKNGTYRWLQWRSYPEGDIVYASARDITDSRKAQEDLNKNEAIIRSTLEAMNDGLLIVTGEGKVIHYNRRFKEIFSIPEKILSQNDDKLFLESAKKQFNNPDEFLKKVEEIYKGIEITKDIICLKDGKILERRSYPIQKETLINGRVWIFRDITEQRKTEEIIHHSEEKYRLLFENITSAVALHKIIYDKKGNPKDYKYIEVNPAFEKQTGIPAKKWIGKTVKEVLPGTEDYWIETFGNVAKKGEPVSYVNFSKELNKYYETLAFCPKKDHFAVVFNDVTNRIKNEENLNKFKASIDYSLDGVYWINEESGFDYVNEQACKMLGYTQEELINLKIRDIDPVASGDNFKILWNNLFQNKRFEAFTVESKHKRKDGTIFPVELNSVFVWKDNKGLLISYAKDISERKEYEEILLKNQKLLNDSQRVGHIGSWEHYIEKDEMIWNEQTMAIFGYKKDPHNISIQTFIDYIHPDDQNLLKEHYAKSFQTGNFRDLELRIITESGNVQKNIRIVGKIELSENKAPYRSYGIIQDITEQKKNEEKILKNQKLLNESQRIAQMGSWELNLEDNSLYWSDSMYIINGIDKNKTKISQDSFLNLVHPDDRNYVMKGIENTIKTGFVSNDEYRIIRSDGKIRTMVASVEVVRNENNQPLKLIGVVQDITEIRQAKKELEDTKTLLTASVLQSPVPIIAARFDNHKIFLSNKAATMVMGLPDYYFDNKELSEIEPLWKDFDEYGNPVPPSEISLALAFKGIETKGKEYKILRKDGTERWINVNATIVKSDKGENIAVFVVFPDITDRKLVEEELIKNQKLLSESQRVAQIGCFENDLVTGKMIFNEEAYKIFGYEYQEIELTMKKYREMIHPDDVSYVLSALKDVIQSKKYLDYEYRIIRKDGEIRNILVVGDVELNKQNELIRMYGIVQDITERKKTEAKYIAVKEWLQSFMDSATDAFTIWDKDLRLIDMNKVAISYHPTITKKEDLIGLKLGDLLIDESKGNPIYKSVMETGKPYVGEEKIVIGNKVLWMTISIFKVKDGLGIVTSDITEKKEAVKALETSEQKMQRIFEFAPVCIGLLDKRVILDINSQVSNLTWYAKEELTGKKTEVIYPSKKEYEKVGKVMYQELKENGFSEFESKWKRKDGKLINVYLALTYLDPEDPSKGVLFSALDITKQKESEKQLIKAKERAEESEFFLQESQRTGNIGSYKMFIKNDYWISTETMDNILGIDNSYTKNTAGWLEIVHPDDREMIANYFQNEVIGNLQPFNKEYRIIRKNDNEIRWLHGVGKLFFNNKGKLSEILGTIQDITERKLLEEQRKQMNVELENRVEERTAQLQQANKDLEAFAYSVSHDLRAPIRHIDGFMHLLENAIKPIDDNVRNYIHKIFLSSKNMSAMIDELLQFSRLGRTDLKCKQLDLSSIIDEIVTQLNPDYKGRDIQWNIKKLPHVYGDPILLKIAFENIISNAVKYTAKKEHAVIDIGQKDDPQSEVVCIYIKDNGAGFDMAYKEKLFGVFQRLHKNDEFEGIGIGLANARQIIKKHNGEIDAESEKNKGATFYITLPKY